MQLLHFEITESDDINTFITFWSQLYSYSNEAIYKKNISQKVFDAESVQELFKWKNGMRLSDLKQISLNIKIIDKLEVINYLKSKDEFELDLFKYEFKSLSAVWKIFLLHIIQPQKFPIYDQHIHRTFLFIHKKEFSNLSNNSIKNKQKEAFYFNEYLPFIDENEIKDLKKLDEAFFAFGQFLNTKDYKNLFR
ncbi:hypothetical protein [Flavobacterium sp.]|uniref:hypothetical protein n=1 Tax=Flavobacterium sp. TaxID=239 RepID=UPI002FDD5DB5